MTMPRSPVRSFAVALGILLLGGLSSTAQMAMPGRGRSLGGYGAATISSYYGGGAGGYMPYAAGGSGFVPYRGGAGGGLGVEPVPRRLPATPIGGSMMAGTPIGGGSLSGGSGMSDQSVGRSLLPFGYEGGAGMTGGVLMRPMSSTNATIRARSGPGFGYPFRTPPSLAGSSSMLTP